MEKEKEKQTIYDRVVELTENGRPNEYFSKSYILEYIRKAIEEETGAGILPSTRKAEHVEWVKSEVSGKYNPNATKIDIDDMLPRQKSMRPLLEELAEEGKLETVLIARIGEGYRATKFSRSL